MAATLPLMNSSYKACADFGDILAGIVATQRPLRIAEYGILDGYSLDVFARFSPPTCTIEARDIFEGFEGNCANRQLLRRRFENNTKVRILDGDFHDADMDLQNATYDLIHVDVANDGWIYQEAERVLTQKLAPGGLLLFEGGTPKRDEVPWMTHYSKKPIVPEIQRMRETGKYDICVLGTFPGLTVLSLHKSRGATSSAASPA